MKIVLQLAKVYIPKGHVMQQVDGIGPLIGKNAIEDVLEAMLRFLHLFQEIQQGRLDRFQPVVLWGYKGSVYNV